MKQPDNKKENVTKAFDEGWDELTKFGDCPYCLGNPAKCPTPEVPAKYCKTRRATMSHLARGRGQIRTMD